MLSPPYNTVDRDDVGRGNDIFCDAPSTRTRYLEEHGPSIYNTAKLELTSASTLTLLRSFERP